jgi:exosome complex component RRP4
MSEIKVKDKDIVVPGEELADGMDFIPSGAAFRENEKIYANRIGLAQIEGRVIKIIPLAGKYNPERNDMVIGKVVDILMSGWRVDLLSPYDAVLNIRDAFDRYIRKGEDLTKYLQIGDWLTAKITNVTSQKLVDLTTKGHNLGKLQPGRIMKISPFKVPRVIGKKGSMMKMIQSATGCKITVGQNGVIWISGQPEKEILGYETIKKIDEEAHTSGLTERIKQMLEKETGKKLEEKGDQR